MNSRMLIRTWLAGLLVGLILLSCAVGASRSGWERQEVDWRMTGGSRIKAIMYPHDKPVPLLNDRDARRRKAPRKKVLPARAASRLGPLERGSSAPVVAHVIDSPSIEGFVPRVAVTVTSDRSDVLEMVAVETSVFTGNYLPSNTQGNYAIGIFDTGASAHLLSYEAASHVGLGGRYVTPFTIDVSGVTGSVEVDVSQPVGIFIDGLGAIEPNSLVLDTSGMVGEWNVSVAVGQVSSPNLPTAIGVPLSVYFAASFRNDQQITVKHGGRDFTSPDIRFYELDDPRIPSYSNTLPLELRPGGGVNVQYIPNLKIEDLFDPNFGAPGSPSTITGLLAQSVFFVPSVDLYEGQNRAVDKDRFMFDTGAQVTVVGSKIAARLRLDPDYPEFLVEIQGVTGDVELAPGFTVDSLEIPVLGEWLLFTDVPVVLLDIFSAEGGTVNGVIGMNLFTEFNFVLRGGGLFLQDDPTLEFEPIYRIVGDVAPEGGDGAVDFLDLATFARAWLGVGSLPPSANWNRWCDIAPLGDPDGRVDFVDFAVLAEHWLESTED